MDVVCGRCRAEYEFDDALISERGTTVRCTNCGLQFKVFPPVGQRAPEVWLVFDPKDDRVEPVRYESLRELQKAIARGDVTAKHLLSRGEEAPRPLQEIVELQPLLHQPRSEPPPPLQTKAAPVAPAPPGSKTVLGIQQRPDPAAVSRAAGAPAPPRAAEAQEDFGDDAVVPGRSSEPKIPIGTMGGENESKPKIRSALSMSPPSHPKSAPSEEEMDGPPSSEGRGSIPPPRQSLRSTLVGSPHTARISPPPEKVPSSAPRPPTRGSQSAPPPVEEKPVEAKPPAEERISPPPATAGVTPPVEPKISDSGEFSGQMTPTPSGLRAYGAPDAQPVSSTAGVPVKQRARTGGIVLSVLVGGAAFLGFANRDKISALLSDARSEQEVSPSEESSGVSAELRTRLDSNEAAWISETFLENPESKFSMPSDGDLAELEEDLKSAGAEQSWEMVNVLRAQGAFGPARKLATKLPKGPEQAYALALLDLAEGGDDPPWPVVVERLREASTGERGQFLARSMYIYALAGSGALPRAKADFEAWGQLAGAPSAPLFSEVRTYLERVGAFEESEEEASEEGSKEPQEAGEESAEVGSEEPQPESGPSQEAPAEQAPTEKEHSEKEPEPKTAPATQPQVSEAIKSKVAQADAMWRGGNQDAALAIYRQVVAEIGTSHFLGQRSAARIAQAERERAGAQ